MDFNTAWEKMERRAAGMSIIDKKTPATIWIEYNMGSASLYAERFFKEKEKTKATVKRAWETFCRGREEYLSGITRIDILIKGVNADGREEDQQITA